MMAQATLTKRTDGAFLSDQQRTLLRYVAEFHETHAYMPPLKRVVHACEYSSHGTALRAILALVARGDLFKGRDGYPSIKVTEQGYRNIGRIAPSMMSGDDEVIAMVRDAMQRVTGGNCTFVDDDIKVLELLARSGVGAGFASSLDPAMRRKAEGIFVAGVVAQIARCLSRACGPEDK